MELLKIKGWDEKSKERLLKLLGDDLSRKLKDLEPDILELGMRRLFMGKGSVKKRLKITSKILGVDEKLLMGIFEAKKKEKETPKEVPFLDVLERAEKVKPWELEEEMVEDLKAAMELSETFKKKASSSLHPYTLSVAMRKIQPAVVDGSNFLWKFNLDIRAIENLFLAFSEERPVPFPVWMVFDRNILHTIPRVWRKDFERFIENRRVFLHSPADELIISIAREKRATIYSGDRFREYDTKGLKIKDFPI